VKKIYLIPIVLLVIACNLSGVVTPGSSPLAMQEDQSVDNSSPNRLVVPHEDSWGIYRLNIDTQETVVLFSSPNEIASLRLNGKGDRFVFSQKVDGNNNANEEIFTLSTDGSDLRRITQNDFWDLYPAWSPDGSRIAFLSQRASSLGIYIMNADGSDANLLYDSSSHEADIDWINDWIVFTKDSSIWIMKSDGTGIRQISKPPRAGEWGNATLPV
jgi:Tol biopolymer transport system component